MATSAERTLGKLLHLLPKNFYLNIQVEGESSVLCAVIMETPPEEGWTIPTYFDEPPGVKRSHTEKWLEPYRHGDIPRIGISAYPDEPDTFESRLIDMVEGFLKKKGLC